MPGEEDIDITQDLDGTPGEGSLGDVSGHGEGTIQQGADGAKLDLPDGVVQAHEAPKKGEQEYSLRDQLSSAFKEPEANADDKPAASAAEVPALTKDAEGRYHTADGLFASAEQIAAFEAGQKPAEENNSQPQAPAYFSRMTPAEVQQFQALPAELQQFVGRTMEAVDGRASQFDEYGLIEQQLIGPRREAWAQNGMTPALALNNLFALSDFATRDPKSFVLWFADNNKIDLDAALDERDNLQAQDPAVRALQQQVQQMQNQLAQAGNGQQQAQQDANLREVQSFVEEKDGAGTLKRPYFSEVLDTFAAHVQALRHANPTLPNVELLQKAYEAACWANPTVRGKMQEEVRKQQVAEATRKAAAARQAGASINGAASGGASNANGNASQNNRSVRQELEAAFSEHR